MNLLKPNAKLNKATLMKEYQILAQAYTTIDNAKIKQDKHISNLKRTIANNKKQLAEGDKNILDMHQLVKIRDEEIEDLAKHGIIAHDTILMAEKEIAELRKENAELQAKGCKCPECPKCNPVEKTKPTFMMRLKACISKTKTKIFG